MIKKFMEWWSQKPYAEPRETIEHNIEYSTQPNSTKEEEFKYETTLEEDIRDIINILSPKFPFEVKVYEPINKITFTTEHFSTQQVREMVKLETLEIDEILYSGRDFKYWWEAEYEDYKRLYLTGRHLYVEAILLPIYNTVKRNFNNELFYYIFCKYEDSIHIVLNAIKDSIEYSGEITSDILEKSKVIINKLKIALEEKQSEIEHIENLQKEAAKKSIVGRLEAEIDFMSKYIESH